MASGDTKTQQYLDVAANGTRADLPAETCCETRTQSLIRGVAERIMDVEDEVERLENNPDVVDIVATYADLQDYDASQLTDKDVIRVLQDETHNDESTYYRWSATAQSWTYIGESKQYTDFVGTDGTTAGTSGLVPAPATADAGKYLKADGTWDDAGSAVNVVQTTGSSTTDVMSQNATTSMIYADPATKREIQIGNGALARNSSVAIGGSAKANRSTNNYPQVCIGYQATAHASALGAVVIGVGSSVEYQGSYGAVLGYNSHVQQQCGVALGTGAVARGEFSVALGYHSYATEKGQIDVSTMAGSASNTEGYNDSQYRLLTGLYDPQSAHDAATKGYVDTAVASAGGAEEITSEDWSALWQ